MFPAWLDSFNINHFRLFLKLYAFFYFYLKDLNPSSTIVHLMINVVYIVLHVNKFYSGAVDSTVAPQQRVLGLNPPVGWVSSVFACSPCACLSPDDSWDWLQPPCNHLERISSLENEWWINPMSILMNLELGLCTRR